MKSLIELKIEIINKYLDKDYRLDETIIKSINNEKIEDYYIDYILFQSVEKSLFMFKLMLLLGTNEEIQNELFLMKKEVNEFFNYEKRDKKLVQRFIKDYNVDTDEIYCQVLQIITHSLKSKIIKSLF